LQFEVISRDPLPIFKGQAAIAKQIDAPSDIALESPILRKFLIGDGNGDTEG
jgi:hypothetical protein